MKRIILVVKEVEKCIECPFFESECAPFADDDDENYTDVCTRLGIQATFDYTDSQLEEENNTLKNWFEELCNFEKIG